jgi:hypothetical protein
MSYEKGTTHEEANGIKKRPDLIEVAAITASVKIVNSGDPMHVE